MSSRHSRKMSEIHEKILRTQLFYLEKECETESLVAFMFSNSIFSNEDMEEVQGGRTRLQKNQIFFKKLKCRGPKAYPVFVEALRHNGQEHVAAHLEDTERKEMAHPSLPEITQMYEGGPRRGSGSDAGEGAQLQVRLANVEERVEDMSDRVALLEDEKQIKKLREELRRAKLNADGLSKKLQTALKDTAKKEAEIKVLKSDLQRAKTRIQTIETQITKKQKEVKELKEELQRHDKEIEGHKEALEKHQERVAELERRAIPPDYLAAMMKMVDDQAAPKPATGRANEPHPLAPQARKSGNGLPLTPKK